MKHLFAYLLIAACCGSILPGKQAASQEADPSVSKISRSKLIPQRSHSDVDSQAVKPLVPGFSVDGSLGNEERKPRLRGFGAAEATEHLLLNQNLLDRAGKLFTLYDRNRNGVLQANEFSTRVRANLSRIDTNRDGQVSKRELIIASTRQPKLLPPLKKMLHNNSAFDEGTQPMNEVTSSTQKDVFGGRRSYRVRLKERQLPKGMPDFFADKDANRDGQVTMSEYSSEWSDAIVADFFRWDANRDGLITPAETVAAETSRLALRKKPHSNRKQLHRPALLAKPPAKFIAITTAIFRRFDTNRDNELTPSEWSKMRTSPANADDDRNGRVTITEYAVMMNRKSQADTVD